MLGKESLARSAEYQRLCVVSFMGHVDSIVGADIVGIPMDSHNVTSLVAAFGRLPCLAKLKPARKVPLPGGDVVNPR